MRRSAASASALFLLLTVALVAGPTRGGAAPRQAAAAATATYADWTTYHADRAHSGYVSSIPAVKGASYVHRSVTLDGAVYASPIVVGGHTIIATENNSVYSLSPGGTVLWRKNLGAPVPRSSLPCGNIDPTGITGTPVYSATENTIYVVALLGSPIRHVMVGLRPTGEVVFSRNVDVPSSVPGITPVAMQQRGALTLEGNGVWVPYGGLAGDCSSYRGSLVRLDRLAPTTGALMSYTVPTSREAGMWTPPGPAVDAKGYLYQSVGNGASGVGDPYDFSDSVLKFDGFGHLVDSFSPSTWPTDNDADKDLGSQGATLVGSSWVFIAGKSGTAYVLNQNHLGGIGAQVSSLSLCQSFGGTAVVGSTVYVPCTDGVRAVTIDSTGHLHVKWHAASNIIGSPVVGGGRVWTLDVGAGKLYGLNPSTGAVQNSVSVGSVTRFATPALYGHLVLVGTRSGYTVVEST